MMGLHEPEVADVAGAAFDEEPGEAEMLDVDDRRSTRSSDVETPVDPGIDTQPIAAGAPSLGPFPTAADMGLASTYVRRFDLSISTLDAILDITRKGNFTARCTRDLLEWVDVLPGAAYNCAEITIPGYADWVYRLFYRDLTSAVDFMLRKHGKEMLRPRRLPGRPPIIKEMWEGRRYQEELEEFRKVAAPTDILLPITFFSGAQYIYDYLHDYLLNCSHASRRDVPHGVQYNFGSVVLLSALHELWTSTEIHTAQTRKPH